MRHSKIVQVGKELIQFSFLNQAMPVQVFKLFNLSRSPQISKLTTLKRYYADFSLAVDLRRYIYITGGN